jgi:hypothetical protein
MHFARAARPRGFDSFPSTFDFFALSRGIKAASLPENQNQKLIIYRKLRLSSSMIFS